MHIITRKYQPKTGRDVSGNDVARKRLERSLDVSGVGSVLMQPFIDRMVYDLSNYAPGPWTALDHRPGSGNAAYFNRRTPATTGGGWIADTSDPDEETGTYAQQTFTYRTAGRRIKVTRKAQAVGRTYADVLAEEIEHAVPEFAEKVLDNAGIVGDNDASTYQPSGLITLIQGRSDAIVANTSSANGDDIVLESLDKAIDEVKGDNSRKLILCSRNGSRKINAALSTYRRHNDVTEIRGGFRVATYDDIPIVKCTQIPDTLAWSGTKVTAFSGGSTTCIIVVNLDLVYWEDLTEMTMVPLARQSSSYDEFDMFVDTVLKYTNTHGGAILGGVAGS